MAVTEYRFLRSDPDERPTTQNLAGKNSPRAAASLRATKVTLMDGKFNRPRQRHLPFRLRLQRISLIFLVGAEHTGRSSPPQTLANAKGNRITMEYPSHPDRIAISNHDRMAPSHHRESRHLSEKKICTPTRSSTRPRSHRVEITARQP